MLASHNPRANGFSIDPAASWAVPSRARVRLVSGAEGRIWFVGRIARAALAAQPILPRITKLVSSPLLFNVNRTRLENLIHGVFNSARLDIEIKDRFGQPVIPREWLLVPLFVINEAFERIRDGSITDCLYDPKTAALVRVDQPKGDPRERDKSPKRNRLIKARTPSKAKTAGVAGAAVPGERARDLARLQQLKRKRHPTKRSTPSRERAKACRKILKLRRGKNSAASVIDGAECDVTNTG